MRVNLNRGGHHSGGDEIVLRPLLRWFPLKFVSHVKGYIIVIMISVIFVIVATSWQLDVSGSG